MLQIQTVEPGTLALLKDLMQIDELADFYLVGGTALSLLYGHRKSIDIDLFSSKAFNNEDIAKAVTGKVNEFSNHSLLNPVGLFGFANEVKVDFVNHHHHPLIEKIVIVDQIRFASIPDIMAMKIAAILKRGVKKDFWDIAELLEHYSVQDFVDFYTRKYPSQQLLVSIPYAMTYFEDAEESENPVSLKGQTWESVKNTIQQKVREYLA